MGEGKTSGLWMPFVKFFSTIFIFSTPAPFVHEVFAEERLPTMRSYQNFRHRMHGHSLKPLLKPLGALGWVQSVLRLHLVQLPVWNWRPRNGPPSLSANVVSQEDFATSLPLPGLRSLQGSPARLPCPFPLCEEDAAATPRHPCPALPARRPSTRLPIRSRNLWNHTAFVEPERSAAASLQPLLVHFPHSSESTIRPNPHDVAATSGVHHRLEVFVLQLMFAAC